jgi:hypothetical protein
LTNTKLVKYYKKLMEEVDTEYPEYEKIIMAYEDRIRQLGGDNDDANSKTN